MEIRNFFKRIFGSSIELERYLLEGDIPKVAKKVSDGLVPGQKKFSILFDAIPVLDRDSLRKNANKLADEIGRLLGKDVKYGDGSECYGIIRLHYSISAAG